jgi:MFS-type transporter involved in bile tolerance (Atg22 family)
MKQRFPVLFYFLAVNKWVMPLLLVIALTLSLVHIKTSNTPHARYFPAYRGHDAGYVIEASPAKIWKDTNNTLPVLLSFGMSVILFAYMDYTDKKANKGSLMAIAVIWLVALLLFFGQYIYNSESSSYTSTITEIEFKQRKSDLDAIFPRIDK